ncbi:MAG: EamA family transporter [Planctomycetota bacterium]|jgi:drug/metabolite transporter (DMT)-like permease
MSFPGIAFALASGLAAGFVPAIFQTQGTAAGRQVGLHFWCNLLTAAFCATVIFGAGLPLGGARFLAVSALAAVLMSGNNFLYFSVVTHRGPVSISWAVVYSAAALAGIMGWVFLGEPVRLLQLPGLGCFLASLALMAAATYRASRAGGKLQPVLSGYWPCLIVALLLGAMGSFGMKYRNLFPPLGHALGFVMMRALVMSGTTGATLLARRSAPLRDRRTLLLAALAAGLFTAAFYCQLRALDFCAASAAFPMAAGSAVFCGAVVALLRGERVSRLAWAGAALAVISIALMSIGGRALWPRV